MKQTTCKWLKTILNKATIIVNHDPSVTLVLKQKILILSFVFIPFNGLSCKVRLDLIYLFNLKTASRRIAGHHYLFMSTEAAKFEYECSLNGQE